MQAQFSRKRNCKISQVLCFIEQLVIAHWHNGDMFPRIINARREFCITLCIQSDKE